MVRTFDAGESHTLIVTPNGQVYAFGSTSYGRLGLGTIHDPVRPYSAPRPITQFADVASPPIVKAVSAGVQHSLFLDQDGGAWSCGDNDLGQLGLGDARDIVTPTKITEFYGTEEIPRIVDIAAGGFHSLFLDDQGQVWGCGNNRFNQLGISSITFGNTDIPHLIEEFEGRSTRPFIIKISAGADHSLLLDSDGNVWRCRSPEESRGLYRPVLQKTGGVAIVDISSGDRHGLLLDANGQVWGFGENESGQIAQPDTKYYDSPVKIAHETNIIAIGAGGEHSLNINIQGQVFGFGRSNTGQLGQIIPSSNVPILIRGLPPIIDVACNTGFSLFLDKQGHLWGCGNNTRGQLGVEVVLTEPVVRLNILNRRGQLGQDIRPNPFEIPNLIIKRSELVEDFPLTSYPIVEALLHSNTIADIRRRNDLNLLELEDINDRVYLLDAEYDSTTEQIVPPPPDNYYNLLKQMIKDKILSEFDFRPEYDQVQNKGFEFVKDGQRYLILVHQDESGQIYPPL